MQQDSVIKKIKKSFKNVDIVFGTFNIYKLPTLMLTNMDTAIPYLIYGRSTARSWRISEA